MSGFIGRCLSVELDRCNEPIFRNDYELPLAILPEFALFMLSDLSSSLVDSVTSD